MEAADLNSAASPRPASAAGVDSILLGPGAAVPAPYYDLRAAEEPPTVNVVAAALHALRRRWFPVAVLGLLLGASAGAAFWFLTETQYTAVARVRVPASEALLPGGDQTTAPIDFELKKRSQMQLVTHPEVLRSVSTDPAVVALPEIKKLNSEAAITAWLRSNVTVTFPNNAEVMELRVRCPNMKSAQELADRLRFHYLQNQSRELENRVAQIRDLTADLQRYKSRFRTAQSNLTKLEEIGADGPPLTREQQEKARQAQRHWDDLYALDQEIWDKEAQLEDLQGSSPTVTVPDEDLQQYLDADQTYKSLQKKIELIKKEIDGAAQQYTGETYQKFVANAEQKVKETEASIAKLTEETRKAVELAMRRQMAMESPAQVEHQIKKLKERREILVQLIDSKSPPKSNGAKDDNRVVDVPRVEIEMQRIEVDNLREIVDRIQRQLDHADMAKLTDLARQREYGIRDDGPVYVHAEEDERRKVIQSCAAGGAVFVVVSALILLLDLRRRKLNDTSDVSGVLQMPVLGTVPLLRGKGPKRMEQSARLAEAVDGVAATLLCRTAGIDHRLVMISSAMAGEGKTTLAANLATSLAAAGRRTLLVDFDLRRPMLHQVYQVHIGPGLGELLSARELTEFGDYLQETMTDNLWLLTAGAKRHGALAELSDERVAELFQEFKEHFEFIIVDGPPVLPVVDTRLVARHADGVVMSMLRDLSELPKVKSAVQLLQSYRVNILGGVVIGASGDVYYGYPPERFSSIA